MRSERNPLLAPAMPMWSGRPRPLPLTFACRHEPAGAPFLARPLREKWEECRHQRHPIQSITPISPPLPPSSFRPTPKPKRVVVILRGCDFLNCHPERSRRISTLRTPPIQILTSPRSSRNRGCPISRASFAREVGGIPPAPTRNRKDDVHHSLQRPRHSARTETRSQSNPLPAPRSPCGAGALAHCL
jgi:hypothetical protein